MTRIDDILVPRVQLLLNKFGASATLTNVAKTYNHLTGAVSEVTVEQSIKCTPPQPFMEEYMAGSTVRAGNMITLIAARNLTQPPLLGDRVTIGTQTYAVMEVDVIRSGEQVCAYMLDMKRAATPIVALGPSPDLVDVDPDFGYPEEE